MKSLKDYGWQQELKSPLFHIRDNLAWQPSSERELCTEGDLQWKIAKKEEKVQVIYLQESMDKKPKTSNTKDIRLFENAVTKKVTQWSAELRKG